MRHLFAPPPVSGGAMFAAALLTPLALGACSQSDEGDSPAPAPSLTTQAMPTTSAGGEPLTQGQWLIGETARGASAAYGSAQSEPVLTIACDRNGRGLLLTRAGAGEQAQTYTIQVGAQRAAVQMSPAATEQPAMEAVIDPTQPIFAAFSDPAQTIEISGPGEPALRLPGHTGISRVIQACS